MSASFTFRGFNVEPLTAQEWIGVAASALGTKGEAVKAGVDTTLIRSYAQFSLTFDADKNVFEMIPELLSHMGGIDHIYSVRQLVSPEYIEVNLVLPFKKVKRQTNGWIDQESISALHKLGATLAFEIFDYEISFRCAREA